MHSHSCRQLHWPHKTTDIKPKTTLLQWASTTTMIGRSFQLKFNKPLPLSDTTRVFGIKMTNPTHAMSTGRI
ncbi:hypothetical protein QTG54_016353 [Skeletonema marinoi]|uniref:Uncharacterized protein n=1 Tax=Skeletonema marinoi TaxID=267567 RepID=A0AAD8XSQ8_9STRA|nr:hypothetical protein QTG54_016353 [Skeletonema marinoi]